MNKQYTKAEARALENYWIANMPGAGKKGNGTPFFPKPAYFCPKVRGRRDEVLNALRLYGPMRSIALAKMMGQSLKTVRADLSKLRQEGLVSHSGSTTTGVWAPCI